MHVLPFRLKTKDHSTLLIVFPSHHTDFKKGESLYSYHLVNYYRAFSYCLGCKLQRVCKFEAYHVYECWGIGALQAGISASTGFKVMGY